MPQSIRSLPHVPFVVTVLGAAAVLVVELVAGAGGWIVAGVVVAWIVGRTILDARQRTHPMCTDPAKAVAVYETWWPVVRLTAAVAVAGVAAWLALEATAGSIAGWIGDDRKETIAAIAALVSLVGGWLAKTFVEDLTSLDATIADRVRIAVEDELGDHVRAQYRQHPTPDNQQAWLLIEEPDTHWATAATRTHDAQTLTIWLAGHPCP